MDQAQGSTPTAHLIDTGRIPPLPFAPVEQVVSERLQRQWRVKEAWDLCEFACHPSVILSDGEYSVFAKFSDAANGGEQFEIELAGLQLLADKAGVLIPTPIGIIPAAGGSILVLEAVQAVERGPRQWRQIGQTLARLHQVKGDRFGLDQQGYFGPLPQDNRPIDDWPGFYAERRLEPMLKLAVDSGNLPPQMAQKIEAILAHLPELCGPAVTPTLIHGDAQQNNFISTAAGAVVIDPAVYYGHPEMDLAFIDYFQPAPQDVFDGYREIQSIDSGFWERRGLWRIYGYLAATAVEGAGYLGMLSEAIKKYE